MGDGPFRQPKLELRGTDVGDGQRRAPFALPSLAALKEVLRRAADMGRVTWSRRFQARCRMHQFSTVDVVDVVREGRIVNLPTFDLSRNAWRIHLADAVDGYTFVVDVALSCEEDFCDSPRIEVVTAFYRRGRRKEVRDWSGEHGQTEDA
jgi:hypothetical protein